MYQEHFRLNAEPFSIAPDPNFLYLSEVHNEALAHLLYGLRHGGFVLITGEVGTGKTTLLRNLVKQIPEELDVAFILNPRLTVKELLESVCDELAVMYDKSQMETVKQYVDVLTEHLLRVHQTNRSTVLIIDEAQNLSPAVLEQIRLLTNLETDEKKLMRIILIGQPELDEMLARRELRQLAQRITARYQLRPLEQAETHAYVAHRLDHAGAQPGLFEPAALRVLYKATKGIPRLINIVADRAMLGAYSEGAFGINRKHVQQAAQEVTGKRVWPVPPWMLAAGVGLVLLLALTLGLLLREDRPDQPERTAQSTGVLPQQTESAPVQRRNSTPDVTDASSEAPSSPQETVPEPPPADVSRPAGDNEAIRQNAFAQVFYQWGVEYPQTGEPCAFASTYGLRCLTKRGVWQDVLHADLPAVLELWDAQQEPYYAALVGRQGNRLTVVIGGQEMSVSQVNLRNVWFGTYTIMWAAPEDYFGSLAEGDSSALVGVARRMLAQALERNLNASNPNLFDPRLGAAVAEFQHEEGLTVDSVIGPMTWVRLQARLGETAPWLNGAEQATPQPTGAG